MKKTSKGKKNRNGKTKVENISVAIDIAKGLSIKIDVQVIDKMYFFFDDAAFDVLAPAMRKAASKMLDETLAEKYGFAELETLM